MTPTSEPLRSAQIFMAREFVKEMKQLGGDSLLAVSF